MVASESPSGISLDRFYAAVFAIALLLSCAIGIRDAAAGTPLWQVLRAVGAIGVVFLLFGRYAGLAQQRGSSGPLPWWMNRWFASGVTVAALLTFAAAAWLAPSPGGWAFAMVALACTPVAFWLTTQRAGQTFACERARPAPRLDRSDAIMLCIAMAVLLAIYGLYLLLPI